MGEAAAHIIQVIAIAIFSLLVVGFYTFLAPFLWPQNYLGYVAIAFFTPLVLTVCILFIRFSRIDTTDSAVLRSTNRRSRRGLIFTPAPVHDVLSCTDTNIGPSVNKASETQDMACCISCCDGSCFPDNEWRKELTCFTDNESWGDRQPQHHEFVEEVLFCSICKAEVGKQSKHCRACDICTEGFDHHCWVCVEVPRAKPTETMYTGGKEGEGLEGREARWVLQEPLDLHIFLLLWLSSCVGRKNYTTFVAMLASTLALLLLDSFVGVAVFIRYWVDFESLANEVIDKLGSNYLTSSPAIVAAVSACVSFISALPLGELLFFHLLLIKKGITTYQYIMAMRTQLEQEESVKAQNALESSSDSTTIDNPTPCAVPKVCRRIAWGSSESDSGSTKDGMVGIHKKAKSVVKISPWQLAKLNTQEATQGAAAATTKGRESPASAMRS